LADGCFGEDGHAVPAFLSVPDGVVGGGPDGLLGDRPDIVCLQELKAENHQLAALSQRRRVFKRLLMPLIL
jgi:hypothetical protein